jgi:PKHD-type hydroxylase
MYKIIPILDAAQVAEVKAIAASATFVDGRITNPHNTAKQNEQLHDPSAYNHTAQLI